MHQCGKAIWGDKGMNTSTAVQGPRIVIIGGGMAGILSAIRLREAGFENFVIYEKADSLGGTWRENRYPGIACDVPSHSYCYEFEPNPDWSYTCSPGAEILNYFQGVAEKYGVTEKVLFGAEVSSLVYANGKWKLVCENGETDQADFVIAATGVLHHPAYPDIDGIDRFAGIKFHSARWDHSVPLEDKKVGVIGSGSSAIQIVGELAGSVQQLTQFQRTPQWIMPRPNPAYTEVEKRDFREHPEKMQEIREQQKQIFEHGFSSAVVGENPQALETIARMTLENLESNVHDPLLQEKLRPSYKAACKRLIISDNYYEAIQRPATGLVTEPIKHIEASGVRTADGKLHKLDVLVLATGFQVDRFLRPMTVIGDEGLTLERAWADRPSAYLSVMTPGFPNLFMLNGPNGPVGNFSLIDVADIQLRYFLQLLNRAAERKASAVSVTAEAARRFEAARVEATAKTVWVSGCSSWYLDDRGVPSAWPWTMARFREMLAAPDLEDLELVL